MMKFTNNKWRRWCTWMVKSQEQVVDVGEAEVALGLEEEGDFWHHQQEGGHPHPGQPWLILSVWMHHMSLLLIIRPNKWFASRMPSQPTLIYFIVILKRGITHFLKLGYENWVVPLCNLKNFAFELTFTWNNRDLYVPGNTYSHWIHKLFNQN